MSISIKGKHKTLGLEFIKEDFSDLILTSCKAGTPSSRIPKRRTNLWHTCCLETDREGVTTIRQVRDQIKICKSQNKKEILVEFGTVRYVTMHPQDDIAQVHLDQMNVITKTQTGEIIRQEFEVAPAAISPQVSKAQVNNSSQLLLSRNSQKIN